MSKVRFYFCLLAVLVVLLCHPPSPSTQATVGVGSDSSLSELAALYPIHPGFPVTASYWNEKTSPTVADINDDGKTELLAADYFEGKIYAWNVAGASAPSMLPGYPFASGGRVSGRLALGDLDRDGKLEIVAGVGSSDPGVGARVFAWRSDGTILPGWPQNTACYRSDYNCGISSLTLADIDNDGNLEVIAGTDNNYILHPEPDYPVPVPNLYAWHSNGQSVSGKWPVEDNQHTAILGTVAVGDFNSDGKAEVVTGRDYNRLFAYDNRGNDLPGWPIYVYVPENGEWGDPQIEFGRSASTLADLDRDGEVDYIIAGIRSDGQDYYYNNDLLVLKSNGKRRQGWETPASGAGLLLPNQTWRMQQAPAIGDLNGDNRLEIVVSTQDGWIRAYTADKTLLWSFDYAQGGIFFASEPVIGDVDGDGLNEVVFGTFDPQYSSTGPVGLWILENDGSPKTGLSSPSLTVPENTYGIAAAPTLADVDDDGYLEIVAATINRGQIYVWDTPAPYDPTRLPWPTSRHDNQRTAFFVDNHPKPDLQGSVKTAYFSDANQGDTITYELSLVRAGSPLTDTVWVTDVIPAGLSYIPHTLAATHGTADDTLAPALRWTGLLSDTALVEITYAVSVTTSSTVLITNSADINAGIAGQLIRSATVILNGWKTYFPVINRSPTK
jgi:uncharacterized repeat protein (TIGR01451 family)